jgi:hypothetical protein
VGKYWNGRGVGMQVMRLCSKDGETSTGVYRFLDGLCEGWSELLRFEEEYKNL